jgi:hypothetical protein
MKTLIAVFALIQALCSTVVWATLAYICWRVLVIVWHSTDANMFTNLFH